MRFGAVRRERQGTHARAQTQDSRNKNNPHDTPSQLTQFPHSSHSGCVCLRDFLLYISAFVLWNRNSRRFHNVLISRLWLVLCHAFDVVCVCVCAVDYIVTNSMATLCLIHLDSASACCCHTLNINFAHFSPVSVLSLSFVDFCLVATGREGMGGGNTLFSFAV